MDRDTQRSETGGSTERPPFHGRNPRVGARGDLGVSTFCSVRPRTTSGGSAPRSTSRSAAPQCSYTTDTKGGVGLAHHIFGRITELLVKTRALVESCKCESGCPSCIHSPKCGSGNKPLDKEACLEVLTYLLEPEKLKSELEVKKAPSASKEAGEGKSPAAKPQPAVKRPPIFPELLNEKEGNPAPARSKPRSLRTQLRGESTKKRAVADGPRKPLTPGVTT